jgi:hypothetical protein
VATSWYEGFRSISNMSSTCRNKLSFWQCHVSFRANSHDKVLCHFRVAQAEPACQIVSSRSNARYHKRATHTFRRTQFLLLIPLLLSLNNKGAFPDIVLSCSPACSTGITFWRSFGSRTITCAIRGFLIWAVFDKVIGLFKDQLRQG